MRDESREQSEETCEHLLLKTAHRKIVSYGCGFLVCVHVGTDARESTCIRGRRG